MIEENYINQEVRVRLLENLTRDLKEENKEWRLEYKQEQEKARQENKQLRLELSTDLKEAIRHFDNKINSFMFCVIIGFIALILTKFFS